MAVILELPDLKIETIPDPSIEPGHEWILFSNNARGRGLAAVLSPVSCNTSNHHTIKVPHNEEVDENLLLLFDVVATIRTEAPRMMQVSLKV